jgi:hypothetical protein
MDVSNHRFLFYHQLLSQSHSSYYFSELFKSLMMGYSGSGALTPENQGQAIKRTL